MPLTVEPRLEAAEPVQEREDQEGRISRGAAMHLFDELMFRTDAAPTLVVPLVMGSGPVLFGSAHTRDEAFGLAGISEPEFVTGGRIRRSTRSIELTLWSKEGDSVPERVERSGSSEAVVAAVEAFVDLLAERGLVTHLAAAAWYSAPRPELADRWLTATAQLLTLGHVRAANQPKEALWGVQNIIAGLRDLATMSDAQPAKLAFLSGLALFRYIGIDIYMKFRDELLAMVESEPDPRSPFAMAAPYAYHLYEMKDRLAAESSRLGAGAGDAYRAWLERLKEPFELDLKEWPQQET